MKKLLMIAAACGLMVIAGAAPRASAGTIEFDTTGSPVVLSDGITVSYDSGGAQSFDTTDPANASPIDVDYGTFTATGVSSSHGNISTELYTINLSVILPGISGGPISGSITGHFYSNGNSGDVDTLQFVPTGSYTHVYDTDGIGSITWTFDATNIGSSGHGPDYSGDMLGEVTYTPISVPVPASALSGSILCGLVALSKARKYRNLV